MGAIARLVGGAVGFTVGGPAGAALGVAAALGVERVVGGLEWLVEEWGPTHLTPERIIRVEPHPGPDVGSLHLAAWLYTSRGNVWEQWIGPDGDEVAWLDIGEMGETNAG